MTQDEIRAFQAKPSHDWEGKPLKADGALGPRTAWALALAGLDPRRQAIVGNACGFVGLVERGTNRGPEIDAWLQRCRADVGSPWCAAFASWCMSVPGLPIVRESGAQRLGNRYVPTRHPAAGDVMWFRTGAWQGHCGIVVGVETDEAAVVEGNHDNAVRIVRRRIADVFFGSVFESAPTAAVPVPPGLPLVAVQREGTR
jgi:hypothetical protein